MSMLQGWTRRHFLQSAGLTVVAHQAGVTSGLPLHAGPTHAYVAAQQDGNSGSVHVFQSRGNTWRPIQSVNSIAPSAVLFHAAAEVLFVANARTQFEGLPTASIESYRVNSRTGRIALIGRRKLGLATVMPHALALSPDGSLLVVAAANGLYNVLPVSRDGSVGEVTAVRKELAFNNCAVPSQVLFVNDRQVQIRDQRGSRLYRCDRNGMELLGNATGPVSADAAILAAPLLSGQRSIAFASFV
jgi:hypothetical protein